VLLQNFCGSGFVRQMKSTRTSGVFRTSFVLLTLLLSACAAELESMDKDIKPADLEALKAIGAKANGLVAWTSSRDGLPHVYVMKTDGTEMRQLTKGNHTDWRPRFSPDGSKILFSRSRDQGFVRESEANAPGTWDLYTVPTAGGELTKVVEDAAWGSWTAGDEIVFVRGAKIMRTKAGASGETKITDTSRYPFFQGAFVQQPEISHDGHFIALTLAGGHRQAGIWNIKKKTWMQMGEGGQIGWAPDGASVYWADADGKDGSRIAREPVVAGTPADERDPDKILLVDLGGKRSRERFPRLSADGKWLVFSASIGSLEDDLEDHEIYLWEVGSSSKHATRLTFNTANDSWPDIFVGGAAASAEDASGEAAANAEKTSESATKDEGANESAGEEKKPAGPEAGGEPEAAPAKAAASGPAAEQADEAVTAPPAKSKGKKKKKHR
jgi:hypothetical protein